MLASGGLHGPTSLCRQARALYRGGISLEVMLGEYVYSAFTFVIVIGLLAGIGAAIVYFARLGRKMDELLDRHSDSDPERSAGDRSAPM